MGDGRFRKVMRRIQQMAGASVTDALTDRQLLEHFASRREESAFAALVERHGQLVLGVCRRILAHEQDAEDAFQATFVVLARKAAALGWHESVAGWLYEVAQRIALKARARGIQRQIREKEAAQVPKAEATAESAWRELRQVLDEELARLPRKLRAPLLLCYLEGKTRDEAAAELGWTLGTVKGRLERGRDMLRDRLVRRGLSLSAALFGTMLAESAASAAVPTALGNATINGVLTGSVSVPVAVLTQGALRAMALSKLKIAAAVLFLVAGLGLGATVMARALGPDRPADGVAAGEPREAPPPARLVLRKLPLELKAPGTTHLIFTRDRKGLFTAGDDKPIHYWELATGKERRHFGDYKDFIYCAALSRDDRLLVAAAADGFHVWDTTTGKPGGHMPKTMHWRPALGLGPDGTMAYTARGTEVKRWDIAAGKELPTLETPPPGGPHGRRVYTWAVAFAPDGKSLAASCVNDFTEDSHENRFSAVVCLFDLATGKARPLFSGAANPELVFSPDGKTLAVFSRHEDLGVRLIDLPSGKERLTLKEPLRSLQFGPDSTSFAAISGLDATIWSAQTGRELYRITSPPLDLAQALALSPDGKRLAVAYRSDAVHLWAVGDGN